MAKRLLAAVLLVAALACGGADAKFSRHSFPKDFVFGTGSAAYQVIMIRPNSLQHASTLHTFSFLSANFPSHSQNCNYLVLAEQVA